MRVSVQVLKMTEAGVQCTVDQHPDAPFWLPRKKSCVWLAEPETGGKVDVEIPAWLAKVHKQLGAAP